MSFRAWTQPQKPQAAEPKKVAGLKLALLREWGGDRGSRVHCPREAKAFAVDAAQRGEPASIGDARDRRIV